MGFEELMNNLILSRIYEQACQLRSQTSLLLLQRGQEKADGTHLEDSLQYTLANSETVFADFSGFTRIITKSQDSTLVVQNRTPGALYVLPPGPLKIKLNQEQADTTGDYLHTGGWMIVHTYLIINPATTHVKST